MKTKKCTEGKIKKSSDEREGVMWGVIMISQSQGGEKDSGSNFGDYKSDGNFSL